MKLPNVNDFQCNPPSVDSVLLTPGFFIVGVSLTRATTALLAGLTSESPLSSGVSYGSSDTTIATVDANGIVTGVSPGVAYITATYNGLSGYATVIVQPSIIAGYYQSPTLDCSNESIGTYLVLDTSLSMSLTPFDQQYSTALTAAKVLAKALANALNTSKDLMGLLTFDVSPEIALGLSDDPPTIETAITGAIPQVLRKDYTDIAEAFEFSEARVKECHTCVRRVLVLLTDGLDDPERGVARQNLLIARAQSFQSRGGIVIVVGMNCSGPAYTLMRAVATSGYFINCVPNGVAQAKATLLSLPALYCGQPLPNVPPDYFPPGDYWYDNLYHNLY